MARICLAMSGGVDSSVAAHLLLEQGHEVVGVFMRHGEQSASSCSTDADPAYRLPVLDTRADHKQGCCSASDAEDARRVADRLGIPFYALNLQKDFGRIIDYFVEEYTAGRTPNPCVMCNNWIKFGRLFQYADRIGAQYVATGHYAQLAEEPHHPLRLNRGTDRSKDQSYVLFGVQRRMLERMMLPVGGYDKREIRVIAGSLGLRVAEKRESQEICFVTSGKHDEFVRARQAPGETTTGDIVTESGEVVGQHPGIERFTIGQRKGLGVALGEPYFVTRIEPRSRRVVIGKKESLARTELLADRTNWLVDVPRNAPFACHAQIRYNSQAVPAHATLADSGTLRVQFEEPCLGVAPGQAVVCYRDDSVLGGGWILSTQ